MKVRASSNFPGSVHAHPHDFPGFRRTSTPIAVAGAASPAVDGELPALPGHRHEPLDPAAVRERPPHESDHPDAALARRDPADLEDEDYGNDGLRELLLNAYLDKVLEEKVRAPRRRGHKERRSLRPLLDEAQHPRRPSTHLDP